MSREVREIAVFILPPVNPRHSGNRDFREIREISLPPDASEIIMELSEALQHSFNPDCVDEVDLEVLKGFGCFIAEIAKDIDAISNALYWTDEPEAAGEEV